MGTLHNSGLNSAANAEAAVVGDNAQAAVARLLMGAKRRSLRRGEALFHKGDPGDGCYMVRKGIIKLSVSSPIGEQRVYALRGPNALVGELSLLDGLPRSTTAEAMTDAEVVQIMRTSFLAELEAHPEISTDFMAMLARRLRGLAEEMTAAAFLPMKARVAGALLRVAELLGRPTTEGLLGVEDNVSQADIALMAGVTRESVSRTFAEWKTEGIVDMNGRFKLLLDVRRLTEEASRHE